MRRGSEELEIGILEENNTRKGHLPSTYLPHYVPNIRVT